MILYQLTRPISYLQIKDFSKWKIDWLLPGIIALVITVGYFLLPNRPLLFSDEAIMRGFEDFLQILPGFYLASLAAIATFGKPDLDYLLPTPTPEINIKIKNKLTPIKLTRRRMLCYLFGYLTFLSIFIYLALVLSAALSSNFESIFSNFSGSILAIGLLVFNIFFWQMIIVTIFGLYQLCDRIHQTEGK